MDSLKNYNIEFVKLKLGEHHFDYHIEDSFFNVKPNSLIKQGKVSVHLIIDKKERLMDLHFAANGNVEAECDICLDHFKLPITGTEKMVIKIEDRPAESNDEIIYLGPHEISFNVYDIIYEMICTNVPMSKTCQNNRPEPKNCNPEMLKFLSINNNETPNIENQTDPRWDQLKKIKE